MQILRDLRSLPRPRLPDHDGDGVLFNEVQEGLAVSRDGEEGGGFVGTGDDVDVGAAVFAGGGHGWYRCGRGVSQWVIGIWVGDEENIGVGRVVFDLDCFGRYPLP